MKGYVHMMELFNVTWYHEERRKYKEVLVNGLLKRKSGDKDRRPGDDRDSLVAT